MNSILAPQELEIMKILWQRGRSTVRDVLDVLSEKRRVAYTTVMTMMSILEKKGHLKKRAEGRTFIYEPTRPKDMVVGSMVRDFVKRVFDGSAEPLLIRLVEDKHITAEEIGDLARRIKGAK